MNYNNPYGNYYGNSGYNYNNYAPQPAQPITNKIYVTSAEDALSRFASPNSITVYFLQDESVLFEIATDIQGKKNIRTRKLVDVEQKKTEKEDYLTRTEFNDFKGKLETLLSKQQKGVKENEAE